MQNPYESTVVVEPGSKGAATKLVVVGACLMMTCLIAAGLIFMIFQQWQEHGTWVFASPREWLVIGVWCTNFCAQLGMAIGLLKDIRALTIVSFALIPTSIGVLMLFP